jgi:DNA-binding MarR family transcriptional regulator
MGVDRTTMVTLIDDLETKGLVERRPDSKDRRKNVVVLTDAGRTTLGGGHAGRGRGRAALPRPLSDDEAARFRETLRVAAFAALPELAPNEH